MRRGRRSRRVAAAAADGAQRVPETQRAGGHVRRVLAEAVPGDERRADARAVHEPPRRDAVRQQRGLRVHALAQVLQVAPRLELCFGVTIQNIPWMQESGWFDGMFELNVNVLTARGTNMHLRWCDSNQGFMVKLPSGGSTVFYEEELSL